MQKKNNSHLQFTGKNKYCFVSWKKIIATRISLQSISVPLTCLASFTWLYLLYWLVLPLSMEFAPTHVNIVFMMNCFEAWSFTFLVIFVSMKKYTSKHCVPRRKTFLWKYLHFYTINVCATWYTSMWTVCCMTSAGGLITI